MSLVEEKNRGLAFLVGFLVSTTLVIPVLEAYVNKGAGNDKQAETGRRITEREKQGLWNAK